ncbi:ISNCY family transposase [Staphylococcus nepalensis]|uniref:ISNCY family transposase n=1 Tax=Staphylococcus nepalensis TaxID=214473 RepID=UPI0024BBA97C|nr:ISNCY family transposase [Staphylococcus nepalensis]
MNNERITLTMKEQKINDVLVKLIAKEINISDASRLTGLSERQIYRKKKSYKELGIQSIPHKNKNKPTGRGYTKELKDTILNLYNQEYSGWNFYHFNDTLQDFHNINVSDTFIYNLFTSNGISSPHKYKSRKKAHPPRQRREYAGELIQVDASKHKWFYGDDTYYYLHGGIDDSTGTVTSCFFARQETIYGYQMIMKQTLQNFGIPECLYTDYRTVFKSTKRSLTLDEELQGKQIKNTRFANMLEHIGTGIISTINPRAKGRIERLWRTFQDRLYNELKKKNINNIEEANHYLNDIFIPKYNARFALPIDDTKNHFICLDRDFDYNKELAIWSEHKVFNNSYLQYDNSYHIILENYKKAYLPTSKCVKVYTFLDGSEHILFNDKWYDLLSVKDFKLNVNNKNKTSQKISTNVINSSKALRPSNSPWKKGLPPTTSNKCMYYSLEHGC